MIMQSKTILGDCNHIMRSLPHKWADIAICDIPYGIGAGKMAFLSEKNTTVKQKNGARLNPRKKNKPYTIKEWDSKVPDQKYFDELRRISKHQIIFGVDYVDWTGLGSGRIKWDKGVADGMSFNRYERAYCSLIDYEMDLPLLFSGMMQAKSLSEPMIPQGNKKLNEKRIHPTQKPVLLYLRLLQLFASSNMKIFDSHLGSGSNRIACWDFGISEFLACEIDPEYHLKQENRFNEHLRQYKLF
jgi:site-specific DNA-methyltransferase (adenine-specific)